MDRVISIALDLSGPSEQLPERVAGCVNACSEHDDINLVLFGNAAQLQKIMTSYGPLSNRIRIVGSAEEVTEGDAIVDAVRKKKDSSLVKGLEMLRSGEAGAFLSCNTRRIVGSAALMMLGKIERLSVSPMATLVPGIRREFLIIDSGSGGMTGVKPADFVRFASMGSLYMRFINALEKPTVGLLSDSELPLNGGMLYGDSYELLRRNGENRFIGTVRPEDLYHNKADVVVCDGFSGGLLLGLISGVIKDIKFAASPVRRHPLFGKSRDLATERMLSSLDFTSRGMTFFPGLTGHVISLCDKPNRDTIQKAIGHAALLVREDMRGRLISLLRL